MTRSTIYYILIQCLFGLIQSLCGLIQSLFGLIWFHSTWLCAKTGVISDEWFQQLNVIRSMSKAQIRAFAYSSDPAAVGCLRPESLDHPVPNLYHRRQTQIWFSGDSCWCSDIGWPHEKTHVRSWKSTPEWPARAAFEGRLV